MRKGQGKDRVLIVDDNEDNRTVYAEYLAFKGYEVETAVDGSEAIAKARAYQPHVVVMDLSLPGVDGWEATRVLKSDPLTRAMHIVAVTGHGEPPFVQRAKDAGCDEVLIKPVVPAALVEYIKAACR